jgi:hypothetical protein
MQLSRNVPGQEPHTRKRKTTMSTRKALEGIIQHHLVLRRTDGIIRQPVHRRINSSGVRLTHRDRMRSCSTDTHLDHLGDDTGDRERGEYAQGGIMSVPFRAVDGE